MTTRSAKKAERISPAEFSRRIGVSKQAVSQAVIAGRLTVGPDKKLDEKAARREWAANTDQSKPRNSVTGNPGGRAGARKPTPTKAEMASKAVEDSFAASRARREKWNEKTAELEYKQKAGALVAIVDVVAEWEDRITRAKNASHDAADQFVAAVLMAKDEPSARAALLGCLGVFFETVSKAVDDEDAPRKKAGRRV